MLGPYFRRLAQYDLRRERWERQIGWYVVTQLQNQSPYMTLELVDKEWLIRPQQPLTLVSILNGSYMPWERMKRNEAGAIIRQVLSALETLKRDGLIGAYTCLDGTPDGSDLPERGRLETMLPGRYLIEPGFLMRPHILKKR